VLFDPTRALPLLATIYGPEAAGVLPRLEALAQRHRARFHGPQGPDPWTQSDVFLIAYPDQLLSPERPPLQLLAEFCREHLREVVSGLHLLPFFPSSSDDGFAVMDHRQVDPKFGTWADIHDLAADFDLMVDLVLNHTSAQSAWFEAYCQGQAPYESFFLAPGPDADWSRVVRPRSSPLFTSFQTAAGPSSIWTTFGPDQVDLDYRRPEVLLEMLDILLEYVGHGAKVIRLDAVAYLTKEPGTSCIHLPKTHALVKLFRLGARAAAPWVRLITETNVPHADNVVYFGQGDEADLVYQFALAPLVLQALISGDARPLAAWAAALEPPPAGSTFLNFLASHDGIGLNGASGLLSEGQGRTLVRRAEKAGAVSYRSDERGKSRPYELNVNLLDFLGGVRPSEPLPRGAGARFYCAHAIMLALAGVPAIYFHSLVGSRGDEAALRSGLPARAINRQRLGLAGLEAEMSDRGSKRFGIFEPLFYLIRLRRTLASLHPQAPQRILLLPRGVFGIERTAIDGSRRLVCLHEVGGRRRNLRVTPGYVRGRDLLSGIDIGLDDVPLDPYQARWIEVVP
jgi:sucrose phosphorylase